LGGGGWCWVGTCACVLLEFLPRGFPFSRLSPSCLLLSHLGLGYLSFAYWSTGNLDFPVVVCPSCPIIFLRFTVVLPARFVRSFSPVHPLPTGAVAQLLFPIPAVSFSKNRFSFPFLSAQMVRLFSPDLSFSPEAMGHRPMGFPVSALDGKKRLYSSPPPSFLLSGDSMSLLLLSHPLGE